MVRHICHPCRLGRVALIILASVAIARVEAVTVEEVIEQRCSGLATVPVPGASSAAPRGALNCSPTSADCYVVPRSVFCRTAFPEQATRDGVTSLTRHLVVMNVNPSLLFSIIQFEIRPSNKNVASQIKGCTGDFKYLDRCIISMSADEAAVELRIRDERGFFPQDVDFSDRCKAKLTSGMQEVLRLFNGLPTPSGSGDHRVILLTIPRESGSYLGTACARG